jgi:putative ATP-dependent endonuclease of OLD family
LLVEEPECHLSHSKLIQLLAFLEANEKKQMLITTHNSFVANKLGLDNLVLLSISEGGKTRMKTVLAELTVDTQDYFRRLAGYDTLRLLLCKRAILVEGPSDELVVQKAYMQRNEGKLPIQNGIDVISVGTAFLRFLEIAEKLGKKVSVVTDNDGDPNALAEKYSAYVRSSSARICYDDAVDIGALTIGNSKRPFNYNTLEPKLVKMNGLEKMNQILDTPFTEVNELHEHMLRNKTECALRLFYSTEAVAFPHYIENAIADQ